MQTSSYGGLRDERSIAQLVVDHAEDCDGCMRIIAQLCEEYERYLESEHAICRDCPVLRSGLLIVYSLLEWKAIYGDGNLAHWTVSDLHEYLLEQFPRKISATRQLLRDTPACVRDFIYFMSDRGTLAGAPGELLAGVAEELFEEFLAANRDPRNWGPAKQVLLGSSAAFDRVSSDYAHTPAIPLQPARAGTSARGRRHPARRAARKAARAARRRNRG
jgi:hypothetical protein